MDLITRRTGPRVTLAYVVWWWLICFAVSTVAVAKLFPPVLPAQELDALIALAVQILSSVSFLAVVWFSSDCMEMIRQSVRAPVRRVDWILLSLAGIASAAWAVGPSRLLVDLPLALLVPVEWHASDSGSSPAPETGWLIGALPLVSAVLIAPLVEELAFRGVMFPAWLRVRGVVVSVLASSALFGLMHSFDRVIMAAVGGILFALLYLHYRSVWPGVFVHATHNLLVQPFFLGRWAYGKSPEEIHSWQGWRFEIGLSVVMIVCASLAWRRARAAQDAQPITR